MTDLSKVVTGLMTAFLLSASWAQAGRNPALRCEAEKLKRAGKYSLCRLRAESTAAKRSLAANFAKCESSFADAWGKSESRAGPGVCPSEGDEASIGARIDQDTADIVTLLTGGVPTCANLTIDPGEQCDGVDLGGADCAALGFSGGSLGCFGSCLFDTSGCTGGSGFAFFVGMDPILTKTGQAAFWGPGSDGDIEAGRSPSYLDNGDGTLTDLNTGLMWEKKDDSGGVHDKDDSYQWQASIYGPGTAAFLDILNDTAGGGAGCFAGYCDWRLPNIKELQSIVDYGRSSPSTDPAFHREDTCTGCTDVTLAGCSCSSTQPYWSSTTYAPNSSTAMVVFFARGSVFDIGKSGLLNRGRVRAVRGGL